MAPELRKRKTKESAISAAKPASKTKVDSPATKRKAADDASPVAAKKPRATKNDVRSTKVKASDDRSKKAKTTKAVRSKEVAEDDEEVNNEDDGAQISDEDDNARALAKVVDSGDEDEDVVDADVAFQEGQDVGEIPKKSKQLLKSSKSGDGDRGVVYIGRLPHGFYEHEMRSYFSQFGQIEKLRMSRNKKTGASRHFAFIEFASAAVAEIVAKTMDNYLLFGRILKVKVVPKSQIHEDIWKGSNRRFKKVPWNKMAGNYLKKPLTESTWTEKITKEEQKRNKRSGKLLEMGYDFEGPKLKSIDDVAKDAPALEGADGEAPKAIEASPKAAVVEQATEEPAKDAGSKSAGKEQVTKESAKADKSSAAKSSKKGKKAKKASA
ncbi:hypothetical protein F5Y04DRAFT_262346 [Hypomontagnella monticulosa]|nr:hypothetical protein F5Y04DRAFT_262346 [Hypomontagnella monticulosa]